VTAFLKEIPMSHKNVFWNVLLILVCAAVFVIPASAQHFQQIKGTFVSVAAGRNEVFAIDTKGLAWRFNATSQTFAKVKGTTAFTQIAIGGGTVMQLDDVWGVTGLGLVFRFNYTTKTFVQIPDINLEQITVGEGVEDNCHPYEVWGVQNSTANAYRYDYCASQFHLSPGSQLTQVATLGGALWGLNAIEDELFHYSFAQNEFVDGGHCCVILTQIAVGVNDLWVIDTRGGSDTLLRLDPNNGGSWVFIGSASQVAAGGDGVWALNASGNTIWRFDPFSNALIQVEGSLTSIAVGSGAGVWGIDSSNQIFTFIRP
jgi:hypothetical protein